jgi:hypothetical protein
METSGGPLVAHLVDPGDPEWLEVKWDFPWAPDVQREIERREDLDW